MTRLFRGKFRLKPEERPKRLMTPVSSADYAAMAASKLDSILNNIGLVYVGARQESKWDLPTL
jgi:hypothetical protein